MIHSHRRLKAVIAVLATVTMAAVGLAVSTTTASAVPLVTLPLAAVSQQAGTITSADFDANLGSTIYPFADGQTVTVHYYGALDSAGGAIADGPLLSTFCGNRDTTNNKPLLSSDIGSLQGVAAHCTDPLAVTPAFSASVASGTITVTGTFSIAGLPAGNTCTTGQVLPCLLIASNLTQTVTFALPVINPRAAAVAGPLAKVLSASCNPSAAPPAGCPVTRVTDPTVPFMYPVAFGGGGYPSSTNIPSAVAAPITDMTLCNTDATSCGTLFGSFSPTGANPFAPVSGGNPANAAIGSVNLSTGALSGAYLFESGVPAVPGDYLARITVTYLDGTLSPITQVVQFAAVRILGAPEVHLSATSGPVNTEADVLGSGWEPHEPVSINLTDINSAVYPLNASPQTTTTTGLGDLPLAANDAAVVTVPNYPAAGVRVTVGPAPTTTNLPFDSAGSISYCNAGVDGDTCAVGVILNITVDPGTLQMLVTDAPTGDDFHSLDDTGADIGDTTTALNDLDLSTILLNDPDTWYPLSDPTPLPVIAVGDFRGANTGWVVTANSSDLLGATQPGNVIPAADVWPSGDAGCEESQIAGTGLLLTNDIPVAYGTATAGSADDPSADVISPLSVDSDDGAFTVCTLDTDTSGLAGGIWDLFFAVTVAGRPITPVDDYAGLITVTVTSQ